MTRKVFIGLTVLATGTVIAGSTYALSQRSEAQPAANQVAAEIRTLAEEIPSPSPEPTPIPTDTPTPTPTAIPTATPSPKPTVVVTATPTPSPEPTPTKYVRYPNPKDDTERMANLICETFDTPDQCALAIGYALNKSGMKLNPNTFNSTGEWGPRGLFGHKCFREDIKQLAGIATVEDCLKLNDPVLSIRIAKKIVDERGWKGLSQM